MANLYDKQADIYADARPYYPAEWFEKLASLTSHHSLAWDAGTGTGQAALSIAQHYERVVATDASEVQLARAAPHPRVCYVHTPTTASEDELVALLGGERSVDLVTVAAAVHWFDLPRFYSVVNRVLRKPGGVIAVWCYWEIRVDCPAFEAALERFKATMAPYWEPIARYVTDSYRSLPFPFEGVGLGEEGHPALLEMKKESSFEGMLRVLRTWCAVNMARERGVELLGKEVVEEMEAAWGGRSLVRTVTYGSFMIAGKPKTET